MLGNGERHAGDVHLLEAVCADGGAGHVAGDGHERHGVQVGGGDAGNQIGGTGAGGGDDHANLAGGTGVAVGGVSRALLVSGQHMAKLALVFIKGIVNVDDLTAGIAKNHVHTLLNQGTNENIRTGKNHKIILSSSVPSPDGPFPGSRPEYSRG